MSDERKLADAIVRVERWTRIGGDSLAVDDDIRALIAAARASLVPRESDALAASLEQFVKEGRDVGWHNRSAQAVAEIVDESLPVILAALRSADAAPPREPTANSRAIDMLRAMEWSAPRNNYMKVGRCLWCGGYKPMHEGCELRAIIDAALAEQGRTTPARET